MDESNAMSDMVRKTERGRGKRVTIAVMAVLLVAALIGVVVVGFQGRHISRNAAAMVAPVNAPGSVGNLPSVPVAPPTPAP